MAKVSKIIKRSLLAVFGATVMGVAFAGNCLQPSEKEQNARCDAGMAWGISAARAYHVMEIAGKDTVDYFFSVYRNTPDVLTKPAHKIKR